MLLIDMDMPESCEVCKFSSYHDGDDYCDLYKLLHGCTWRAKDAKWNEDCPLRSVDDMVAEIEGLEIRGNARDVAFCKRGLEVAVDIIRKYTKENTDGR